MATQNDKKDICTFSEPTPQVNENGGSVSWTGKEEKALVRKIDIRIFPVLILLFILNFIDRNNFANARLKGLEKDLHLTDVQYQTCISILLVGYVSMQVPSNVFLNYINRPSLYLCSCVVVWGLISGCTAATVSFDLTSQYRP
jgi:fucose permease